MKKKAFQAYRTLTLVFACVIVLAGCSGNSSTDTPTTTKAPAESGASESAAANAGDLQPEPGASLLIWEAAGAKKVYMEKVIAEFQKKFPDVQIEYSETAGDKSVEKMITDAPAGIGADVFVSSHDNLGRAVASGIILNLEKEYPDIAKEVRETHVESGILASSIKGELYGFPKTVETMALYYNKDIFPEPPTTFEQAIEFAKTWNDPKNNKFTWMGDVGNAWAGYGFISSYGGYVFGDNGTNPQDIGVNNEGAIKGLTFMQSLSKVLLPVKTMDIDAGIRRSLFLDGKLALNVSGPWDVQEFRESGINFGVTPMLALPGGTPFKTFSSVQSYYINEFTKYPNAAVLFAQFASTKEMQLLNFEMTGSLPSNIAAGQTDEVKNDPISSGFVKQFEHSEPTPSILEMPAFYSSVEPAMSAIYNDGADVKTALDNAAKSFKDAIKLLSQ
ncbi:extracellular solute-binding protein [Cohnella faecalis]|uniref:sugar ABC transporter substrate-binding protein n=1 Tax=Cohnella faecalis TaxID=2315694 RepID=UPI003614EC9E